MTDTSTTNVKSGSEGAANNNVAAAGQNKDGSGVFSSTCGLCFGLLKDPCTMPCGHSYCTNCIKLRLDRTPAADGFCCPLCGDVTGVNETNVRQFFNEHLAERISILVQGGALRPTCQWCEETFALVHCPQCHYSLCRDCNVAVHKNSTKRGHMPIDIQDQDKPFIMKNTTKKCTQPEHGEYRMDFYCIRDECLCCAYCLQMGPHKGHENVVVSRAAGEVRQQLGRHIDEMQHVKATVEAMGQEMNNIHGHYLESYDRVEQTITDRFEVLRKQLLAKEAKVRRTLAEYRKQGDVELQRSRHALLEKVNGMNEAFFAAKRLSAGGSDTELLENRALMSRFQRLDVGTISGTGFKFADVPDLNLGGIGVSLDLVTQGPSSLLDAEMQRGQQQQSNFGGGAYDSPGRGRSPAAYGGTTDSGARGVSVQLTFTRNPLVDMRPGSDGLFMRCATDARSPGGQANHIGLRANETMEVLRQRHNSNVLSWKIRLDSVANSRIGVVEDLSIRASPEGFYWRPKQQRFDGKVGQATAALRAIPPLNDGEIVTFTYDYEYQTIRLATLGGDRGVIVTDVHAKCTPCIVFTPGDAMTLLN